MRMYVPLFAYVDLPAYTYVIELHVEIAEKNIPTILYPSMKTDI